MDTHPDEDREAIVDIDSFPRCRSYQYAILIDFEERTVSIKEERKEGSDPFSVCEDDENDVPPLQWSDNDIDWEIVNDSHERYILSKSELHESRLSRTKASRRTGIIGTRAKVAALRRVAKADDLDKFQRSRRRRGRKQPRRQADIDRHLASRHMWTDSHAVERGWEEVVHGRKPNNSAHKCEVNARRKVVQGRRGRSGRRAEDEVLPAAELGLDGDAYERLMEIVAGDDVRPEDYDILLRLDKNNVRTTLGEDEVAAFDILVVGSCHSEEKGKQEGFVGDAICKRKVLRESLGGGQCLVCLVPFSQATDGTELRQLPCGHTYCRECIDRWLGEQSARCPDLSCFWVAPDDDGNKEEK